jgi:hypothetical protein
VRFALAEPRLLRAAVTALGASAVRPQRHTRSTPNVETRSAHRRLSTALPPTGVGNIDQCRKPGSSFDLTVDVNDVTLLDGTRLTVTLRRDRRTSRERQDCGEV